MIVARLWMILLKRKEKASCLLLSSEVWLEVHVGSVLCKLYHTTAYILCKIIAVERFNNFVLMCCGAIDIYDKEHLLLCRPPDLLPYKTDNILNAKIVQAPFDAIIM